MAFKNPFTIPKLKTIKAPIYVKALRAILGNKLKDGESVPFSIILNHIYNGFDESKSAKLPFFLLGEPKDGESNWKKFRDSDVGNNKKQKDFMLVGTCHRQGSHLKLELNKSKGLSKIPRKTLERLEGLLRNIDKSLTVGIKEAEEAAATVVGAASAGASEVTKEQPTPEKQEKTSKEDPRKEAKKKKIKEKYKKEKRDEAVELSEQFKNIRSLTGSEMADVVAHVKAGTTTRKDIKFVKKLNKAFSTTEKLYKKTGKQVQQKFATSYQDLVSQKEQLYKLSLAVKKKKKSVAERLAEAYFSKKKKRTATEEEIKIVQGHIKDVMAMNKKRRKKANQALLLSATSYVLRKTGIKNFKTKYVNQILQKKVA